MRYMIFILVFVLSACANDTKQDKAQPAKVKTKDAKPYKDVNYIGVTLPNFSNDKIDSLVTLYETDRESFYKAKENDDMTSYYKTLVGQKDDYSVAGFHEDVIKILNTDKDTLELQKFQKYMTDTSNAVREFNKKTQEN